MNTSYTISRDSTGRLQAIGVGKDAAVVADFLSTDIGENASHCDMVLELLERCLDGRSSGQGQDYSIGNIYRLSVEGGDAVLANIHDDQVAPVRLPASELLELLDEWRGNF